MIWYFKNSFFTCVIKHYSFVFITIEECLLNHISSSDKLKILFHRVWQDSSLKYLIMQNFQGLFDH